jgi:hypothetical protein
MLLYVKELKEADKNGEFSCDLWREPSFIHTRLSLYESKNGPGEIAALSRCWLGFCTQIVDQGTSDSHNSILDDL